jgi:hypothetical protein
MPIDLAAQRLNTKPRSQQWTIQEDGRDAVPGFLTSCLPAKIAVVMIPSLA